MARWQRSSSCAARCPRCADISFDLTVVADYEFALLGNTPLNPDVKMTPFIPFQAKGVLTFSLDEAAINDPGATTVPFTGVTGVLDGVSPAAFLPHQISPNLEFLGGNLTNVFRDSNGFITSARSKICRCVGR